MVLSQFKILLSALAFLALTACTGTPDNIDPIDGFELNRYTGKWYEIARLNHSFEENLEQVTAQYTLNDDGSVNVINRGFNYQEQIWDEAHGKAKFVASPSLGHLKVSFFGAFYGSYVIFKLDKENYQYAYITSYNKEYLWFLSRTPKVSAKQLADFKQTAERYGFNTNQIIYVKQK